MAVSLMFVFGVGLMALGNVLHIVGLATPHWQEFDRLPLGPFTELRDVGLGLFKVCAGNFNKCFDNDNPSSANEGVRALCILGCLLAFGGIGLAIFWFVIKSVQGNKMVPLLWAVAAVGAFGFIIIGVVVYAAEEYSDHATLGYSFALCIVGAIAIAVGGGLSFRGARMAAQ